MATFIYENPAGSAAVNEDASGSREPPPPAKAAKEVLTEYEKRERRNRKAREKRAKKTAEKMTEDGGDDENDGDISSGRKQGKSTGGTRPKKQKVTPAAYLTDEDDEPPVKFPICIFIEGARPVAAPTSRRGPSTANPALIVITKGPFFSYDRRLVLQASAEHCTAYPM